MTPRDAVTPAEARDIAQRFIDGHFGNPRPGPRVSIPANPDRDDDLRLLAFIEQAEADRAALDAARAERDEAKADQVPPTVDALLAAQMDAATARAERDALREAARALLNVCTATQPMRDYDDAAARLRALLPEPGQ